jgi:[DsrC]-trisulfide reductase subunit J
MSLRGLLQFVACLALVLPALAFASDRTPKPDIVIANPGHCVEPTEIMRRNHPEMLFHQRDLTMHQGIRTTKYNLERCVACHASKTTDSVLGPKGFCQSCHAYAGVTLDCFECHASKPKLATGASQ